MTKEKFIYLLHEAVITAATTGVLSTIANPPGRKPKENIIQLSRWFKTLSKDNQKQIAKLVDIVAEECLFGVCAVLDGVRVVDAETKCFEISQIDYDSKKTPITGEVYLHDLLK